MNWHYADNGKQVGPVTEDELIQLRQTGKINDTTLVWQPGLPNWVPYRQINGPANPAPTPKPAPQPLKLDIENPNPNSESGATWHYEVNGQQTGPVAETELRQLLQAGKINDSTLVWRSGMTDWVPYRQVKSTNPAAQSPASPAPLKLTADAESPVNTVTGNTGNSNQWHYEENGQQAGPVNDDQLRRLLQAGRIDSETLVWRTGMPNWLPYRQAMQLSSQASNQTQSAPASTIPIGSEPEVVCAECGRMFPTSETIRHGKARVCATCKPIFLQKLSEGASLNRRMGSNGRLESGEMAYAGFWTRFAAQFLDGLLLTAVNFGIKMIAMVMFAQPLIGLPKNGMTTSVIILQLVLFAINLAIAISYESVMVGKYGATLGKMACKIMVVRANGQPVGYGLAIGRYFAKLLSALTCCIGYIIAGFDEEKRALHDHICSTRVIYK